MKRLAIVFFLAACGPKAAPATTSSPAEETTETAPEEGDPAAEGAQGIADDEAHYACVESCLESASGEGAEAFCEESCSDDGGDFPSGAGTDFDADCYEACMMSTGDDGQCQADCQW